MPENEFDKQVKKMMGDLKLRPSNVVWPAVEKRIYEKKRRRRAFIFLLLVVGLMLLGYSGIHYFNSKTENKKSEVSSRLETNTPDDNKVSIPLKSASADKENRTEIKEDIPKQGTTIIKEAIALENKIRKVSTFKKDPYSKQFLPSNRKTHENFRPPQLKEKNRIQEITFKEDKNEKTESSHVEKNNNKTEVNIDTNIIKIKNDSNLVKEATVIKSVDSNLLKKVTSFKSANDSPVSKKQQHDKKLTWGFHLSTGVSGISSKFLQLNQNNSLDSRSSLNLSTGGTAYAVPVSNSSKAGIALKAGMLVEKTFSKRSSLDLGIQYSYYTDQIKVGHRTDSVIRIGTYYAADLVVSGFYPNASTNDYINQYHFIELSGNYHFLLINGKQNSLIWDFGLSIGQLLSTNTLVFDTANRGVYYTDKKLFRKINANLSTGFSMMFNKYKSIQWIVGPQLQFGLINLYKSYTDKKAYPFFAGVDLRVMLPNK